MSSDAVTIILPAYNMSAAMRYAIESVLIQTHREFELLVVGDHCTDDSEDVTRSFGDPRIHWFNLPHNVGNQYGPINFGLQRATSPYIAYMGHDDIWAPHHLATGLKAFGAKNADLVVNVSILYGPRESRMKGAMGLHPNDEYSPRYTFSPPAVLHTRELAHRVGGWRSPAEAEILPDYDFYVRCHRAGARIVFTREPTVFKFNTSYRRDAYRRRETYEQQQALAALRIDPDAFIRAELVSLVQCAMEDRFIKIEAPATAAERAAFDAAKEIQRHVRFKDTTRERPSLLPLGREPTSFSLGDSYEGWEWHFLEHDSLHGDFRWSGPSTVSTIMIPYALDRPTLMRMHVIHVVDRELLATMRMTFNDRPIPISVTSTDDGRWMVEALLTPQAGDRSPRITIEVERTIRPFDVLGSEDRRWLGLAVNRIELHARET
jgi:glycosyltransferase involved in cell wall biosynthesis